MKNAHLLVVLLVVGVLVAGVMAGNLVPRLPDRDSGVFLYAGQRILEGDVPYRDFWDHKGPAIFYVNALGLALGGGAEAGVWFLEVLALGSAGLLGYVLLRGQFGFGPALLSTAGWLATVGYTIRPGNYTEEYGLPIQFAALLLFTHAEGGSARRRSLVGVGLALAGLALLRPNNTGVAVSILVLMMLEAMTPGLRRRRLGDSAAILAGLMLVAGSVLIYFATQGALDEMWDAVVVFNSIYMRAAMPARVDAIPEGFRILAPGGLGVLGAIGWVRCVLTWRSARGGEFTSCQVV
ncbi:MAG: hypothetical protein FJZ97_00325 [Chloroflexi bacterium]|nr:hypothetical protein [Chloroflexota bacterium]